jgi:hypothetical protein
MSRLSGTRDHVGQLSRNIEESPAVVANIQHQVVDALQCIDGFEQLLLGRRAMVVEGHVADVAGRRNDHVDVLHHGVGDLLRCHRHLANRAVGVANRESMLFTQGGGKQAGVECAGVAIGDGGAVDFENLGAAQQVDERRRGRRIGLGVGNDNLSVGRRGLEYGPFGAIAGRNSALRELAVIQRLIGEMELVLGRARRR